MNIVRLFIMLAVLGAAFMVAAYIVSRAQTKVSAAL